MRLTKAAQLAAIGTTVEGVLLAIGGIWRFEFLAGFHNALMPFWALAFNLAWPVAMAVFYVVLYRHLAVRQNPAGLQAAAFAAAAINALEVGLLAAQALSRDQRFFNGLAAARWAILGPVSYALWTVFYLAFFWNPAPIGQRWTRGVAGALAAISAGRAVLDTQRYAMLDARVFRAGGWSVHPYRTIFDDVLTPVAGLFELITLVVLLVVICRGAGPDDRTVPASLGDSRQRGLG
jgi:hypothetical protein